MIPFGEKDGLFYRPDEVPRGLECGCICPACGATLQAHQGEKVRWYFSHYRGADCGFGYESALHKICKLILVQEKKFLLPSLTVWSDRSLSHPGISESKILVKPWKVFEFDEVLSEKRQGKIIPDIIMIKNSHKLLIEMKVTHGVDENKLQFVQDNNISMVECDFSKMDRFDIDLDHIKSVLTKTYKRARKGHGRSTWIHHSRLKETRRNLNHLVQQEIERADREC